MNLYSNGNRSDSCKKVYWFRVRYKTSDSSYIIYTVLDSKSTVTITLTQLNPENFWIIKITYEEYLNILSNEVAKQQFFYFLDRYGIFQNNKQYLHPCNGCMQCCFSSDSIMGCLVLYIWLLSLLIIDLWDSIKRQLEELNYL